MVLIVPQQYGYLRKAYVLEVPKIAWASLDMAFKGRGSSLKFALKVLTFVVICQSILNMHRMEWQQHGKALCFETGRVARSNLNKNFKLTVVVSKLKRTEVVTAIKCQLL